MNTLNIEVMGRKIALSAPEEETDILREAVRMLNNKIETVRAQNSVMESETVIIFAALNLVHDFLRDQGRNRFDSDEAEKFVDHMIQICQKHILPVEHN
ncbi:MAG: cell division protein ZapA [Neisseriaceae bacterium]|nr:cell division protein ZapA [Neisseriaceae bacterium]MBR0128691.1 cell division protein ZapA [Neisseriaceae bacterium]